MNIHLFILWLCFVIGQFLYILKRAYYLVTGPNPKVPTYTVFFKKYAPVLIFRLVAGVVIYGLSFDPAVGRDILGIFGITWQLPSLPQVWVVALGAGLSVDAVLDFATDKIPVLKKLVPNVESPSV